MARRCGAFLAMLLVAACQSAGTPTAGPTAGATQAAAGTTSPTVTTPAPAPTKPVTLPRVSDVPLDGTCEAEDVSCLGKLEAGKVYKTKVFTPTMTFSVPSGDWVNPADIGGDFGLRSTRDIGDGIIVFRDARSVDKAIGTKLADIAAWIQGNSQLTVTPSIPATIGGFTGVSMDLRIRPGATSTDPQCPVQVCVSLLRGDDPVANDPYQWHWDWGLAGMEVQRVYLLDGGDTVIAIFVDSIDGLTFDSLTKVFDSIAPTIAFG